MLTARYWAHWRKCLGTINYKMLKMLWEPGFLYIVCSEVVRAWASFTCFTFSSIGQELVGCLLGVGVVVLGLVLLVCFVLSVTDLSFWSSCLTMTTLAQLHDCHSCNDERSIVQKKILQWLSWWLHWLVRFGFGFHLCHAGSNGTQGRTALYLGDRLNENPAVLLKFWGNSWPLTAEPRDPPEQGDEEVAWRTYYKVEEMIWEALWARRFYHFCEDFHRLFFVCFLVLVGFVFGLLVLFCFLSRWKDSCK